MSMGYTPSFSVGDILTNDQISTSFKVGNMGGMRKSNTYNCLVLISDNTKGLYADRWDGDVLHYTGMGKIGNQVLQGNQNGTLYNSRHNGVAIHLFEVFEAGEYTYRGVVNLVADPYQEVQPDENGTMRKVWMFPIKPVTGAPTISADRFHAVQERKRIQAERMSSTALENIAKANSTNKPGTRKVSRTETVRDPYVSEYAKRMADGKCALCHQPAPFEDKNGKPYLETHHIIWLSKGGADSIDNTVALCPNCHRKMHVVNEAEDVRKLQAIFQKGESY